MRLGLVHDDARIAQDAGPMLAGLNNIGLLRAADVHVAQGLCRLVQGDCVDEVQLAVALTVHAVRGGSVCVDLARVAETAFELDRVPGEDTPGVLAPGEWTWPDAELWLAAVVDSPLTAQGVLRVDGTRIYLDRYWLEEGHIVAAIRRRMGMSVPEVDELSLARGLDRVFPVEGYEEQRAAVQAAVRQRTTILTGGPGTGKTTTAAGLLALLSEQYGEVEGRPPRVALAAPTARAAARLQEAISESGRGLCQEDRDRLGQLSASTIHRLLGWRPDSATRFKHNRHRQLPFDIVVVDEASMISLTMMARLLEAVSDRSRLILLGDPGQLVSVEAGAVLADLVEGFNGQVGSPVVNLVTVHRFGGAIGDLAAALRQADPDLVMEILRTGHPEVSWVDPSHEEALAEVHADALTWALDLRRAAESGDAEQAMNVVKRHRLLCAHREGSFGVEGWNALTSRLLFESGGGGGYRDWFPGRPVLVTANDRGLGVYNGDLGVVVRNPDSALRVHFPVSGGTRALSPSRLPAHQTAYAMTVHKAQGSQAREITVIQPPIESAIATRSLLYTAVTRAQEKVRIVGTDEAIRAAVTRDAPRATGLAQRLRRRAFSDYDETHEADHIQR